MAANPPFVMLPWGRLRTAWDIISLSLTFIHVLMLGKLPLVMVPAFFPPESGILIIMLHQILYPSAINGIQLLERFRQLAYCEKIRHMPVQICLR